MPRLKVKDAPQHGTRRVAKTPGRRKARRSPRLTQSTIKKKAVPPKKRHYLSKDEQALLALEYARLPPAAKRGKGAVRTKAIAKLCAKWDVDPSLPRKMIAKLHETKKLRTRDGSGGAPTHAWTRKPRCASKTHFAPTATT